MPYSPPLTSPGPALVTRGKGRAFPLVTKQGASGRSIHGAWWVDALLFAALGALIAGIIALAHRWEAPLRPSVDIDLSLWALPKYTLFSLARGVAAYILSFVFTLIYGTVAAYSRPAERVMIPVLDILQGIPVLGFLPGL